MVSFRFSFSFSQPPRPTSPSGFSISAVAVTVTVGAGAAITASRNPRHPVLEWVLSSQGVYSDCDDVKKLAEEKYANLPASEVRGNKAFMDDLMEADIKMTLRLQIVYGKLNIRSVHNAFQESVGNRLKKFGGLDNNELLQRY